MPAGVDGQEKFSFTRKNKKPESDICYQSPLHNTHIRKWPHNAKHVGHIATPSLVSSVSSPNQSLSSEYVLLAEILDEFT